MMALVWLGVIILSVFRWQIFEFLAGKLHMFLLEAIFNVLFAALMFGQPGSIPLLSYAFGLYFLWGTYRSARVWLVLSNEIKKGETNGQSDGSNSGPT